MKLHRTTAALVFLFPICQGTHSDESRRGIPRILKEDTTCSFNDLLTSVCSLDEYCSKIRSDQGIAATCSGDVSGEWRIWIHFDELCYPSEAHEDSFARNIGDLPELGFCSIESAYLNFRGAVLESAEHQEIVTHPKEAKGLVQKLTFYTPCDDAVADTFFGRGYCADPCPQTKLQGSLQCSEECIVCPDGREVLNCSNVHSTLVEECGNESAFVSTLLAYLRAEMSGSLLSDTNQTGGHNNTSTEGNSDIILDDMETTDHNIDTNQSSGGILDGGQETDQTPEVGDEVDSPGIDGSTLESSGVILGFGQKLVFFLALISSVF